MTHEAAARSGHGHSHADIEAEILAALWEEIPFPRLPLDAPPELRALLAEIENPKRVYTIHRATRRHSLQLLIERFISQLRYGCGYDDCSTPSCFSCRRRLAGKAPIRRYSPTSARTLAVHLAGQDNPEIHLCPNLGAPRGPSDAIKPLIFGPKPRSPRSELSADGKFRKASGAARQTSAKERNAIRRSTHPITARTPSPSASQDDCPGGRRRAAWPSSAPHAPAQISINERPIRKDYRSFAANVFGSVAFKMLEWLNPNNMDAISAKAAGALEGASKSRPALSTLTPEEPDESLFVQSVSSSTGLDELLDTPSGRDVKDEPEHSDSHQCGDSASSPGSNGDQRISPVNGTAHGCLHPVHSRRNSNARVRTTSKPGPLPNDHFPEVHLNDGIPVPTSPLSPTPRGDKPSKGLVRSTSRSHQRSGSKQRLHDVTTVRRLERTPSSSEQSHQSPQLDGDSRDEVWSLCETVPSVDTPNEPSEPYLELENLDSMIETEAVLPQSLSCLDEQAIEFLCNVLQEDGTAESHLFEPQIVSKPKGARSPATLKRRKTRRPYPRLLKLEWKLFIEQSIFNTLSDPHAVLESFTNENGLLDSHTLWYRMLRLTRAAPSLVFDSLWIAAASLFAPPKALRSSRSPTASFFPKHSRSLTNEEAGQLLSICFHALVAAAPLVTDSAQIVSMSRIRSRGLTLSESGATTQISESGAVARQPSSLCLQYEDAFTDDLALRLARRLLAAIPTRKYFDELVALDTNSEDGSADADMLEVLLSHLEPEREPQPPAELSYAERVVHEKRVPILILDWARTVMLNEWQGRPDVPGDGPFGGALSLITAMHQKRKTLILADGVFRTDYFGDRLDSIEMPVSWLNFNPTRMKAHLLDYPFIFQPSSLVSYFRAVNFSRMSRAYEESSSLHTRITAIIATDSLVTDPHQKGVLQDLLKIASSKFLILDIGRQTVIRDAFDQLWRRQERELMRPLKVHLGEDSGEEGFDSGGVQQEFFRLAIAEALNPDYGAFIVDERTRMTWFQPGLLQPEWKYELIGLLISLAVFNGLTLPITFPKALYMKLLGEPVTELHHIADGWPDLANGLTTLSDWDEKDGAVEDIFARTYEFSIDMFGQPVSREMEPGNGGTWPQFGQHSSMETLAAGNPEDAPLVTSDNREAYISDYIRYLTDVSVAPQFEAFARGFRTCLNTKSLQLLTPSLLQSVVEGTQEIDIAELRRAARYVGWDASHRTVRDFWSIVRRYDEGMKRKLLEFVTASDRVPVGGVRNVQFVVQRNGEEEGDGGHLPTAYTCYGTLLLPEYRDKEVLRERLAMALENAQGFGFA